ncbi:MAG: AbrB/MazE/SpoVT family DNA-binding domain-containing protein [bacterium]
MAYTVQINSRGNITIPKEIRDDLGAPVNSKILFIKKSGYYIIKPVRNLSAIGGSFKIDKPIDDKTLTKLKKKAFLRSKNIY